MGWTFTQKTRGALVAELLGDRHHKTLAHGLVGNSLWCVKTYQREGQERRYIALFLLDRGSWGPGGWGYKDLCESMHPYYYNCPLHFLALAPVANEAWRAKVYEFHGQSPDQVDAFAEIEGNRTFERVAS
jgi:hypothetical protein